MSEQAITVRNKYTGCCHYNSSKFHERNSGAALVLLQYLSAFFNGALSNAALLLE